MAVTVAISMTLDARGDWLAWDEALPGVRLVRLPTREAATLLGYRAYQELLVELCQVEGVGLLVTHPPHDFLDEETAGRLRAAGARVLAYAADEGLAARLPEAARAALGRVYDRWITPAEVPWATAPLPELPARELAHEVALVGRANPRRLAVVARLRAAGLNVVTRGPGWADEDDRRPVEIPRGDVIDLYSRSAVVLTTADPEDRSVPGLAQRLLETAMLGAFQVAQETDELRRYFLEEEVPSWTDPEGLVGTIEAALADRAARQRTAQAARARALREHTWTARWPALVAGLDLTESPAAGRSRLFDQLLLALASRAEAEGRTAVAAALFEELHGRDPAEPAAAAGLGRCRRDLGQLEAALAPLRVAAAARAPLFAAALATSVEPHGSGTGLGRLSAFPPAAEPTGFLLATLVDLGRLDEALALVDALHDPALLDTVTQALGGELPAALKDRLGDRMATRRSPG